ncbi:multiple sugar transport system permease protein [Saccharopolyspora antimicrobica]|uniref:Carbohydrate ABC transporter membrane protein 2 (CUT1 family) n=1 Tax=Saccharopolyspora antimicrobica TaxID=455193 RepID=A0A1I4XGI1_9PSEU|nr:carbohydrate ABC transporter permease [Saccharopolyspora antimicrobica]RKT84504.1 carbohydrate ABC transporter membrane protein 2 (CUT1 family) [Saccharopolyspora antimicrobica]SFN25021.1 multiple sugar transport system permease protein [Saccharopolyspora antimicrobica]
MVAVTSARRRSVSVVVHLVLAVVALAFLAPLLWLLTAAFDADAALSAKVPETFTLDNFAQVLSWEQSGRPLWNGLLMCAGAALISVVAAVLCAYPLSRYQLRFRRPFLYVVLFASGLPITAVMVPVYSMFVQLELIDSMFGTTLFLAATSLPIAIWMTKNFMDGVPISLEEAAWVDGASAMQALRTIVLPLIVPGMSVVAIFTFITAWGNFFVPFILLLDPAKQPASVGIFTFFGQGGLIAYGQLAAYSILYTTPVVALYLIVSRSLGGAFNLAGAIKH